MKKCYSCGTKTDVVILIMRPEYYVGGRGDFPCCSDMCNSKIMKALKVRCCSDGCNNPAYKDEFCKKCYDKVYTYCEKCRQLIINKGMCKFEECLLCPNEENSSCIEGVKKHSPEILNKRFIQGKYRSLPKHFNQ